MTFRPSKRFKLTDHDNFHASNMSYSKTLQRPLDANDRFLSSDFEASFASNMSLSNTPNRNEISFDHDGSPMVIDSPPPVAVDTRSTTLKPPVMGRPRARTFGREIGNSPMAYLDTPPSLHKRASQQILQQSNPKLNRAALPMEWLQQPKPTSHSKTASLPLPEVETSDAMDIDMDSSPLPTSALVHAVNPAIPPRAVTTADGVLQSLFFDASPAPVPPRKRRSHSPEGSPKQVPFFNADAESSSPGQPSPLNQKFERFATTAGVLPKTNALSAAKRLRRPVLSTIVPSVADVVPSAQSAQDLSNPCLRAVPRRAFSALPGGAFAVAQNVDENENSLSGAEMSSPAQMIGHRQQRSREQLLHPVAARNVSQLTVQPTIEESPRTRAAGSRLPGHGDHELHGKILPCHSVKDDGLVRITAETVNDLLAGHYDDKIQDFMIIDCRFEYEYEGGHIQGAVNINTVAGIEEALLQHENLPEASVSGDEQLKSILIFHCEFSAKRAPALAKHLRSRDRAANGHVYPRIHYPEVYILEGGYCQYFTSAGRMCEPDAYTAMDDPKHAKAFDEDLRGYRRTKWDRTKSFTYGQGPTNTSSMATSKPPAPKHHRNTAPAMGSNSLFAAGLAARGRRGAASPMPPVEEDGDTSREGADTSFDSPCPPANKTSLGGGSSFRGQPIKPVGRMPLGRSYTVATFAPA